MTRPTAIKGLEVVLESMGTDTLILAKLLKGLKTRARWSAYNFMENHMAEMVSRLGARGMKLGPNEAEFAYFTMDLVRPTDELQRPSMTLPIYGENSASILALAAYGAPWEGGFKLQLEDPPVSRYEAWINQDKAVEYMMKWKSERTEYNDDIQEQFADICEKMPGICGTFTKETILEYCKLCSRSIDFITGCVDLQEAEIVKTEERFQQAKDDYSNLYTAMHA